MKVTVHRYRRPLIIALHLVLAAISYGVAYWLRFDGAIPPDHWSVFVRSLPLMVALRAVSFWVFRLYRGLWRYVSIWDLNNIILGVASSSVVFGIVAVRLFTPFPRAVLIIDAIVLILMLGGVRLVRRTYREFNRIEHEKRILIYGAGDAGEMLARDVKNNRFYNRDPIGFIDDDPTKTGRLIHGIPVLGTGAQLHEIVAGEQPHEVIIAIARIEPAALRGIVKSLERFKIPIKTLPNLRDVFEGKVKIGEARELAMDDLIARKPIELDIEPVRQLINGRCVLVTGAGGSIGSELSRQLAAFGPSRLLLLDRYENSLFELCNQIDRVHGGRAYEPLIGDICDARRVDALFELYRPDVVFHAAAHKHVGLMEVNSPEAVKNNVRGTRILAEASIRYGATEFVLISSDKAVNPSSVMGATKRVAETIVRSLNGGGRTRLVAVRFGNVLGSNGSVMHIFREQIARGGPVTVTHAEIRRYFMLIPEAVQLVLHAAAMNESDAVYALEMGEPIRIQDLARNLIRLSGFVPDEEIKIEFVGLRPGEKMSEELVEAHERAEQSSVPGVVTVRSAFVHEVSLKSRIAALEAAADAGDTAAVWRLLGEIVPTFRRMPASAAVDQPKVRSRGI